MNILLPLSLWVPSLMTQGVAKHFLLLQSSDGKQSFLVLQDRLLHHPLSHFCDPTHALLLLYNQYTNFTFIYLFQHYNENYVHYLHLIGIQKHLCARFLQILLLGQLPGLHLPLRFLQKGSSHQLSLHCNPCGQPYINMNKMHFRQMYNLRENNIFLDIVIVE